MHIKLLRTAKVLITCQSGIHGLHFKMQIAIPIQLVVITGIEHHFIKLLRINFKYPNAATKRGSQGAIRQAQECTIRHSGDLNTQSLWAVFGVSHPTR
ncbi:Uncharacterised protein [Vibrio cholerae]|nr:Uncharacterised protein [Vibrio cholerae]CSB33798.1 Uncharacterised protein [Vibrio cholerae]